MTAIDRAFIRAFKGPAFTSPAFEPLASVPLANAPKTLSRAAHESTAASRSDARADNHGAAVIHGERLAEQAVPCEAPAIDCNFGLAAERAANQRSQPVEEEVTPVAVGLPRAFEPALGVAAFQWPQTCTRLFGATSRLTALAEQLERSAAENGRVIAICGTHQQVGGTTLLLCLARELARRNPRTIVVDANFRRPMLAEQLGMAITSDWHDALAGRAELAEVTVYSERDRFALLPLHRPAGRSALVARGSDIAYTFAALRQHYPVVLVDAGPLAASGSSALDLIAQATITAAIVVRDVRHGDEQLSATSVQIAAAQLAGVGCTLLGVAENFCDFSPADRAPLSEAGSAAHARNINSHPPAVSVPRNHANFTRRETHDAAAV